MKATGKYIYTFIYRIYLYILVRRVYIPSYITKIRTYTNDNNNNNLKLHPMAEMNNIQINNNDKQL